VNVLPKQALVADGDEVSTKLRAFWNLFFLLFFFKKYSVSKVFYRSTYVHGTLLETNNHMRCCERNASSIFNGLSQKPYSNMKL